jgi:hypothetical protein
MQCLPSHEALPPQMDQCDCGTSACSLPANPASIVAAAADFPDFSMMFPKQANAVVLRALAGRPKTPQRDRQFYTFISGRPCSLGMPARVDGPATNNGEHQPLRKCAAGTGHLFQRQRCNFCLQRIGFATMIWRGRGTAYGVSISSVCKDTSWS